MDNYIEGFEDKRSAIEKKPLEIAYLVQEATAVDRLFVVGPPSSIVNNISILIGEVLLEEEFFSLGTPIIDDGASELEAVRDACDFSSDF